MYFFLNTLIILYKIARRERVKIGETYILYVLYIVH